MKCTAPAARDCWRRCASELWVSLDLVSRKGDPRYRPLVLPALKHLDYLTINELEASEFAGWRFVYPTASRTSPISPAPPAQLDAGVRQRVVIHCPEGMGRLRTEAGRWYRHGGYRRRSIGASARGRLLRRSAVWRHERWPLTASLRWLTPAPAPPAGRQRDRRRQNAPELQAFIQLQNV